MKKEYFNAVVKKIETVLNQLKKSKKRRGIHGEDDTASIAACDELIHTIESSVKMIKKKSDLSSEELYFVLQDLYYKVRFLVRKEHVRKKPTRPDFSENCTIIYCAAMTYIDLYGPMVLDAINDCIILLNENGSINIALSNDLDSCVPLVDEIVKSAEVELKHLKLCKRNKSWQINGKVKELLSFCIEEYDKAIKEMKKNADVSLEDIWKELLKISYIIGSQVDSVREYLKCAKTDQHSRAEFEFVEENSADVITYMLISFRTYARLMCIDIDTFITTHLCN